MGYSNFIDAGKVFDGLCFWWTLQGWDDKLNVSSE